MHIVNYSICHIYGSQKGEVRMEEVFRKLLKDDEELLKKYLIAEERYYKKLGNNYATVQIELDLDDIIFKDLFIALARAEICFDDFMLCLLKEEIVRKEMEKLCEN